MKKGITKWLIGAFALTMAVVQPASPVPEKLNTVVTAEAATTAPGKIKLKSIKAVTNNRIQISWEKTSGCYTLPYLLQTVRREKMDRTENNKCGYHILYSYLFRKVSYQMRPEIYIHCPRIQQHNQEIGEAMTRRA